MTAAMAFASFAFPQRRGAPDWRAVLSLDPERYLAGLASAADLQALQAVGAQLRGCALEPDARLSDGANAARFSRAAQLMALAADLDAAAAAEDLHDAFDKLDALRAERDAWQARAALRHCGAQSAKAFALELGLGLSLTERPESRLLRACLPLLRAGRRQRRRRRERGVGGGGELRPRGERVGGSRCGGGGCSVRGAA